MKRRLIRKKLKSSPWPCIGPVMKRASPARTNIVALALYQSCDEARFTRTDVKAVLAL